MNAKLRPVPPLSWISTVVLSALTAAAPLAAATGSPLAGTSWRLVRFQSSDDKTLTPPDPSKYTIAFGKEGRAGFRVDCNRGSASWKSATPSGVEFGPMALTRAMCPPSPLTDRFARDMGYVRSFVLKGGHLFLSLMADGGIYEFAPASPAPGEGGALDCAKASSETEKLICGDPALTALDRKLASVFAEALHKAGTASERLKAEEAKWVAKRDGCATQKDPKACLAHAYEFRTADLQARARLVGSNGPVTYRCSPSGAIVATFYETDPPSTVLEKDGKNVFAMASPSGSGMKYGAAGVEFWEKGREAQVNPVRREAELLVADEVIPVPRPVAPMWPS